MRGNPQVDWPAHADKVGRTVLARFADEVDSAGRWPTESIGALRDAGLLGLTVPVAQGGAEAGPRTVAAVLSTLAEHCASTAMIYLMHVCGLQVIMAASAFPNREAVLRAAAAGRHLSTLAFSEAGSRSNFWAPVSQAARASDGYQLSADKSFVTSAGHADSYIVSTRSASDATSLTLYYVPRDVPGLLVGSPWNGLGLRGNASAPVRLNGVLLPASDQLSEEGQGFAMMMEAALPIFQLGS